MSNTLNQRTAAVVDPILSTHARGYRNLEFIAPVLFPAVPVPNRSMKVLRFDKSAFRLVNTRRAPGAKKKRIQPGYGSDPISLVQDALEGVVPEEYLEEANSVPGIDLGQGAVEEVLDITGLGLEYDCAKMARDAAGYSNSNKVALAGTDRWSSSLSDPEADISDAKEVIRRSIGRYPNTLALGPTSGAALKRHAKIKEHFKYTGRESITEEMLAAFFDVKRVVIGKAVYLPETSGDEDPALDVWGDDAILAYVPEKGNNFRVPSYGYTYELKGYPHIQKPYWDDSTDSWVYPAKFERRPYLVGPEGGFLFQNAGAAAA
ncbi:hypothetical protein G3A56_07315 [Rhizobium oryzihabitans]|uniref:Major capsid protein n=1 Tax=Rhizobium oryzihabitans TaxID=2267833 RepID=A0A7L5BGF7_9HYPH|nr:hypothetical protein [Rhizobium oryzihabitans]EGP57898.1 hypothetical protein Agau_C100303 [Agrobacterium tumefaciens F2]QIB37823.1 hypothetical protein G3A56_07315 [Rhizobium oryzihabitans]